MANGAQRDAWGPRSQAYEGTMRAHQSVSTNQIRTLGGCAGFLGLTRKRMRCNVFASPDARFGGEMQHQRCLLCVRREDLVDGWGWTMRKRISSPSFACALSVECGASASSRRSCISLKQRCSSASGFPCAITRPHQDRQHLPARGKSSHVDTIREKA